MRRIFVILLAIIATLPAMAQSSEENYIQVNGTSEIEVTPNEIFLSIVLDESDTKGRQEIELQRRQMVSALNAIGIDTEKQLTIADISSSYFKRGTSLSVAKYQLKLTNSEQVVAVYDKLSAIGISNITISRVSHSDLEQYKSRCRKEAMQNAKQVERAITLSGSFMPQRFKSLVDKFGSDPAAMKQAGIAYATDQIIDLFANGVTNVHVYSMNKPDVAEKIQNNLSDILGKNA